MWRLGPGCLEKAEKLIYISKEMVEMVHFELKMGANARWKSLEFV